jgi:hypothetical protein
MIDGYKDDTLEMFSKLKELKKLTLKKPVIKNLKGLESLRKLRELNIWYSRKLGVL